MTQIRRYLSWFLTAALIAVTAACAPTPERRATGEFVDDAGITARVKTALVKAEKINAHDINVNTFRGEVVLTGFVENEDQIQRAGAVARGVPGVNVVRNDLRVTPRRSSAY
jgi:hyperosmotically inducible protein